MMSDHKDAREHEETQEVEEQQNVEQEEAEEVTVDDNVNSETTLWREQCVRISAEFENYKKRVQRDQAQWTERAKEQVLKDLLSFIDDFERALQQKSSESSGIEMMYQSLLKVLSKHQVSMIADYKEFDPEFHEAVMQVASDDHEAGQIVEVFSKGFMIQDRVLRPAKVSVAQ